ncbi:chromate transporter [Luteibacter sp.]|uniref:chromate transporter n=1 Tax=Luteibacter sp. TaxID=1886636 RepID=UPI002F409D29
MQHEHPDDRYRARTHTARARTHAEFSSQFAGTWGQAVIHGLKLVAVATVSLLAIFLPGLLVVSSALPVWRALAARTQAVRMLAGVNAAVVGLLASALYDPVWIGAIHGSKDFAIAVIAFVGLMTARCPPLLAVVWCVLASLLRGYWP